MRPNLNFLYFHFDRLNALCYAGTLPRPSIKLNNRVRSLGLTCSRLNRLTNERTVWIEISKKYDLPESEIIDTLLHEMIHYYIMINRLKDTSTHGLLFKAEMKRLKEDYGLNVTVSYKAKRGEDVIVSPSIRYFCISHDRKGNYYITVVAKTRIFVLWSQMDRIAGLTTVGWYVGKSSKLIHYPKNVSGVKLFSITREEIESILPHCLRLQRKGNIISPVC